MAAGVTRNGRNTAMAVCLLGASLCSAAGTSSEYPEVTVEGISYQGNSRYKVVMLVNNRSDKVIEFRDSRVTFDVQTEILGQWKALSVSGVSPAGGARLSAGRGLQAAYTLSMPLAIPNLYRNGGGDINMRFKYLIRFVAGSEERVRSIAGESSYWVTPKTNTWVLREGM